MNRCPVLASRFRAPPPLNWNPTPGPWSRRGDCYHPNRRRPVRPRVLLIPSHRPEDIPVPSPPWSGQLKIAIPWRRRRCSLALCQRRGGPGSGMTGPHTVWPGRTDQSSGRTMAVSCSDFRSGPPGRKALRPGNPGCLAPASVKAGPYNGVGHNGIRNQETRGHASKGVIGEGRQPVWGASGQNHRHRAGSGRRLLRDHRLDHGLLRRPQPGPAGSHPRPDVMDDHLKHGYRRGPLHGAVGVPAGPRAGRQTGPGGNG